MIHVRFILRQTHSSGKQALVLVLCVALSLLTLVSLGGFSRSVRSSMLQDARHLHAADIIIHSHYPLSAGLEAATKQYEQEGLTVGALVHEFYSMVTNPLLETSLLSHLKVVEEGYPFYGRVELGSGRELAAVLAAGTCIVEQRLLDRLGTAIGDTIQVGNAGLRVVDTVIAEPDRPVSFFSFGPRVFISATDLLQLDLVKKGSRIHYNYLIRVFDPARVVHIADGLAAAAVIGQERVNTFQNAESGVKRFFVNFLFFLNLIGIFTLLLAGIGIQTALHALLRDSEYTIGILKAVGATNRFICLQFITMIILLGACGTFLGLLLSVPLQLYFPALFAGILPAGVDLAISWGTVFEGLVLGSVVVGIFSFIPLCRLKNLRPAAVFRKESGPAVGGFQHFAAVAVITCFFTGLTVWQLEDVRTGIFFVFGLFVLLGLNGLFTHIMLFAMRKRPPRSLLLRQAFKGLFRPKNATRAIVITLSSSLAVIFSLYLIEKNLLATFINSYPPDLPNAYFLDIQTSQRQDFAAMAGTELQFYPIVRARLAAINGKPIDRDAEKKRRRDNLSREFNLTYRTFLLDDEELLEGGSLFGGRTYQLEKEGEVPVSVLDTVADIGRIRMGDLLEFTIQGFPVRARVTSLRTRTQSKVRPFFYFVFPEKVLQEVPQTLFSAARLEPGRLLELQYRLAAELPNISVIDIGQTITVLARIMHKLSVIIRFFSAFSIFAGLLIIISSTFATRLARIREAVYYKVIGARPRFILQVFVLENLALALMCVLLAGGIGQAGSWLICSRILNIFYNPWPGSTLIMAVLTALLVVIAGTVATRSILQQKPADFLRDEE